MKNFRALSSRVFQRSLDFIEVFGNKLPHPATIFGLLALSVMLLSWLTSAIGYEAIHPVNGTAIQVKNLVSGDGIRWIYTNMVNNFVMFPPLGYEIGRASCRERV